MAPGDIPLPKVAERQRASGRGCRSPSGREPPSLGALVVLHAGQAAGQTAGLPWQRECLAFLKEKLAGFMCRNGHGPPGADAV